MHGTGYLETRRRHPGLLAAAVALHVGLAGVILSYHPEILPVKPDAIGLIPITTEPPPPPRPVPVEPRTTAEPQPRTQVDRPTTTVFPLQPQAEQWPDTPPLPPGPLIGEGDGGGTAVLPPPEPVVAAVGPDRRFIGDLQPPYPPALQRAEIEGNVTVRVQVGIDGRVTAVELVKADNPAFFASTRDWALKRWRFKPATRDGVPVAAWITRTVRFEIDPLG